MGLADAARVGPDERAILDAWRISPDDLLGAGGECRVFAVDDDRVLRVMHPCNDAPGESDPLVHLLEHWDGVQLVCGGRRVALPSVLERGRTRRQSWSLERRIPGTSQLDWLRDHPDEPSRRRTLTQLLDLGRCLRQLPLSAGLDVAWSRPLAGGQRFSSLVELLDFQIDVGTSRTWPRLAALVPDLADQRSRLLERLASRVVAPTLVHADLHPGNVMVDHDGAVTGVLDFSAHLLVADPVMDEVGAAMLLNGYPQAEQDAEWACQRIEESLGADAWLVDAYRRYYSFYYAMDEDLLDACAAQLRRPWPAM